MFEGLVDKKSGVATAREGDRCIITHAVDGIGPIFDSNFVSGRDHKGNSV